LSCSLFDKWVFRIFQLHERRETKGSWSTRCFSPFSIKYFVLFSFLSLICRFIVMHCG
jgi:hypothetical protein